MQKKTDRLIRNSYRLKQLRERLSLNLEDTQQIDSYERYQPLRRKRSRVEENLDNKMTMKRSKLNLQSIDGYVV